MEISRNQAAKIFMTATDQDDPYWDYLVEDFYNEETDEMPTIYDIMKPLGFTKEEVDKIDRTNIEEL